VLRPLRIVESTVLEYGNSPESEVAKPELNQQGVGMRERAEKREKTLYVGGKNESKSQKKTI